MDTIIIKADKENSRLIKALAKKLGATVTNVIREQYEDFLLGTLMKKSRPGKTVSRKTIIKKLKQK
jgi:hypothetical protein